MKRKPSRRSGDRDRDTMRSEYDFSRAVRGATATRYREGANIVVIDPSVLDVFPDGRRVNQALRALAPERKQRVRLRYPTPPRALTRASSRTPPCSATTAEESVGGRLPPRYPHLQANQSSAIQFAGIRPVQEGILFIKGMTSRWVAPTWLLMSVTRRPLAPASRLSGRRFCLSAALGGNRQEEPQT
jgi:hypothetical protein